MHVTYAFNKGAPNSHNGKTPKNSQNPHNNNNNTNHHNNDVIYYTLHYTCVYMA